MPNFKQALANNLSLYHYFTLFADASTVCRRIGGEIGGQFSSREWFKALLNMEYFNFVSGDFFLNYLPFSRTASCVSTSGTVT